MCRLEAGTLIDTSRLGTIKGCFYLKKILASLLTVVLLGTFGFITIEGMKLPDALLSAVSVMSLAGIPDGLSQMGKLFTTALIVGSISVIVAGIYAMLNPPAQEDEMLTNFFGNSPGQEDLMMKEVKIDKRSPLAGRQKAQILESHGLVVVGIKSKGGFDVNVPLKTRIKSGSSALLLGTPAAIIRLEKKK